ncbi:MAG: hypothetical protein DHS20C18_48440 [Saprospiraceae bacterium]|nr:MAG: hypothetical protein DHS20C18_48440 [Saprospiraceae bacterium]
MKNAENLWKFVDTSDYLTYDKQMSKFYLILAILSFCYSSHAQIEYQDSTKYYAFEVNYWFNLHHFLWLESFMNVNKDSTIIEQNLPQSSKFILSQALDFYKKELVDLDLRTSDYMNEFKHWITKQVEPIAHVPPKFERHMSVLKDVSDIYRTHFWPTQKNACINVLEENIQLIRQTEEKFVDSITYLTRQFWQFEKLKVNITYVAKASKWNLRNRPYTTIFPTHVVMNAIGENQVKGNWIELLYHESAHHLILGSSYFIGGTISDVTETMKIKPPRQLGHSYLFYLTGEITKGLLREAGLPYDKTYMERNHVFSKYHSSLGKYLQEYMDRKITLSEATKNIIIAINNMKK